MTGRLRRPPILGFRELDQRSVADAVAMDPGDAEALSDLRRWAAFRVPEHEQESITGGEAPQASLDLRAFLDVREEPVVEGSFGPDRTSADRQHGPGHRLQMVEQTSQGADDIGGSELRCRIRSPRDPRRHLPDPPGGYSSMRMTGKATFGGPSDWMLTKLSPNVQRRS